MTAFCGQISGKIGSDGRIKLPAEWKSLFLDPYQGQVVLSMLPEGCLALWPRRLWEEDCSAVFRDLRSGLPGAVGARELTRLSGAFRRDLVLNDQGRIRIPESFRDHASLRPGEEIVLVGAESRVEIWDPRRWENEQRRLWNLSPGSLQAATEPDGGDPPQ